MILQLFCISLCILAPLRTVLGGNYYKSFAHSVLESLPDSVKPHFLPVFSQIVQTCAQFESDRFENPDLIRRHFYFGNLPFSGNSQSAHNLATSIQSSLDSLKFNFKIKDQKKFIWFSASLLHFCSETAIPHRIHPGFLDSTLFEDISLPEDEKLESRHSVYNFPVLCELKGRVTSEPENLINSTLEKNRSLAEQIVKQITPEWTKKSHSSDRHHKNGNNVMVSLYQGHSEPIEQMVKASQYLALELLVSVSTGNQKLKNK